MSTKLEGSKVPANETVRIYRLQQADGKETASKTNRSYGVATQHADETETPVVEVDGVVTCVAGASGLSRFDELMGAAGGKVVADDETAGVYNIGYFIEYLGRGQTGADNQLCRVKLYEKPLVH